MSTRVISVSGARGGQGATTVAAALALHAAENGPAILVSTEPASAASLLGVPLGPDGEGVHVTPGLVLAPYPLAPDELRPATVVVDAGPASQAWDAASGEHYVVLRGPCYVALASLLAAPGRPDGVILVAEDGRSLTARDVTEVLDVAVVATVAARPAVARTIDAGLLVSRIHRMRELAPLRALATDPYAGRPRPSTARARQPAANGSKPHTDLPYGQGPPRSVEWSRRRRPS